jgi:hypothetical protein
MLNCQLSFGTAVGAPVVFFVGSFLYGIISNLSFVGDNDTSHALAFGQWWMTIPHVAIVSGCLLAGNNPNTLEAIVSSISEGGGEEKPKPEWGYQPYYQSVYLPALMWSRGRTKRFWMDELDKHYSSPGSEEPGKEKGGKLGRWDWIRLVIIALMLMAPPSVLAFLTPFYTPTLGLSCRSLTFLLYFVFQVCLGILWLWDFPHLPPHPWFQHVDWLPFGKVKVKNAPTLFGLLLAFTIVGSVFTAVVGTFLHILGVYRNYLCSIPIGHWRSGETTRWSSQQTPLRLFALQTTSRYRLESPLSFSLLWLATWDSGTSDTGEYNLIRLSRIF